jgi:hypothetical protein
VVSGRIFTKIGITSVYLSRVRDPGLPIHGIASNESQFRVGACWAAIIGSRQKHEF